MNTCLLIGNGASIQTLAISLGVAGMRPTGGICPMPFALFFIDFVRFGDYPVPYYHVVYI